FPSVKNTPYFFTLGAHSFQWFSLEKSWQQPVTKEELPELSLQKWEDLVADDELREKLEGEIFPGYLPKTNWFWGKHRVIYTCSIIEHINISINGNQAT